MELSVSALLFHFQRPIITRTSKALPALFLEERRVVSGLIKLIYPNAQFEKKDVSPGGGVVRSKELKKCFGLVLQG